MDVLTNLRTFLAVARCGGFSEAARQLHVVPSVAAKRVAQLEKTMGTRLFERSTRKVALTDAGQQLQAKAYQLVAGFDEVVAGVKASADKLEGHIRLMAPTTLTMLYLGEVFNAFLRQHEGISLEVVLEDKSANPLEEGFDMTINGRFSAYESVIDIPLAPVRPLLVASPDYLARHGEPAHPRELVERECLVFKPFGRPWLFQSARGILSVEVQGRLIADDNVSILTAAKAGMGIAVLPEYIARPALEKGTLRPILTPFPLQQTWFRAHVPARRRDTPRIRALLDWLAEHLREVELPEGSLRALGEL